MPFDKFVDIETIQDERRKHVLESLRSISIDELRKLAKEHQDEFVDDPWRDKLLRLIEERPQASFYHAVPQENVVVRQFARQDHSHGVPIEKHAGEPVVLGRADRREIQNTAVHRTPPPVVAFT